LDKRPCNLGWVSLAGYIFFTLFPEVTKRRKKA